MSLEDVRSALGIPLHYLQAMEGTKSRLVADQFYLIPFLRRYADFLELDAASTVGQFLGEAAREEGRATVPKTEIGRSSRWLLILLLVIVAAAAGAWLLWPAR